MEEAHTLQPHQCSTVIASQSPMSRTSVYEYLGTPRSPSFGWLRRSRRPTMSVTLDPWRPTVRVTSCVGSVRSVGRLIWLTEPKDSFLHVREFRARGREHVPSVLRLRRAPPNNLTLIQPPPTPLRPGTGGWCSENKTVDLPPVYLTYPAGYMSAAGAEGSLIIVVLCLFLCLAVLPVWLAVSLYYSHFHCLYFSTYLYLYLVSLSPSLSLSGWLAVSLFISLL